MIEIQICDKDNGLISIPKEILMQLSPGAIGVYGYLVSCNKAIDINNIYKRNQKSSKQQIDNYLRELEESRYLVLFVSQDTNEYFGFFNPYQFSKEYILKLYEEYGLKKMENAYV